jgi:DNA primase
VTLPVITDGKSVNFLFLPPEDDPDSFVRARGKDAFIAAAAHAMPLSAWLVSEIAERNDLKSDEGRIRFLNEAGPLIAQVKAPGLGLLLRKRLAELSGVTVEELARILPGAARAGAGGENETRQAGGRRGPPPSPGPRRAGVRSTESRVMTLMLAYPRLAAGFDLALTEESELPQRALVELAAFIRDCDFECSQALVLESFRGKPEELPISEALAATFSAVLPDEASAEAEFADYLVKLRADQRKARRSALARKAAMGPLSADEVREYRELMQ